MLCISCVVFLMLWLLMLLCRVWFLLVMNCSVVCLLVYFVLMSGVFLMLL